MACGDRRARKAHQRNNRPNTAVLISATAGVTLLTATREGDRRRSSRRTSVPWPGRCCLRRHDTLAQIPADFGIPVGAAHAYPAAVVGTLADRIPCLLRALRETAPDTCCWTARSGSATPHTSSTHGAHAARRHPARIQHGRDEQG